ncbi:TrkH family potassium uptake protein [Plantibacter sp. MPB07]|uniref:TrkH family potassium uptake protein n=1 Tax=Plantibacter sp. MPB07 TaxID=3388853 RepID=UPI003986A9C6
MARDGSRSAGGRARRRGQLAAARPVQVISIAFGAATLVGTLLLMLPISKTGPGGANLIEALFTATSAICVTGHIIVDTPVFWTPFGHAVILTLVQIGGIGVMSFATLLGLLVARRLGLRTRLTAVSETHTLAIGDVRRVLRGVILIALGVEVLCATILALRWMIGYGWAPGDAIWFGVFHAVSAFNNAGFALFSDSIMGYATDPWISLTICAAVILGGLGFGVILELRRRFRTPSRWTLNTMTVVVGTLILLVVGCGFITALEWSNPATLGALAPADRLLAGFTAGVLPRTAGFNNLDVGQMHPVTWLVTDLLMFIGGGPASTAGGLKITTFAVLFFIIVTELRGGAAVNMFGKRLPRSTHREAITVALLSVGLVVGATAAIMLMTDYSLDRVLFEVISAYATVGLSTGITASLPVAAQLILVVLMFVGRIGPIALGSALALRTETRLYELPKERPIIG